MAGTSRVSKKSLAIRKAKEFVASPEFQEELASAEKEAQADRKAEEDLRDKWEEEDYENPYDDGYEILSNLISLLQEAEKETADYLISIIEDKTADEQYTYSLLAFLQSSAGASVIEKAHGIVHDSKAEDIFADAGYIIYIIELGQYSGAYDAELWRLAEIDEIDMRSRRGKSHSKREIDL